MGSRLRQSRRGKNGKGLAQERRGQVGKVDELGWSVGATSWNCQYLSLGSGPYCGGPPAPLEAPVTGSRLYTLQKFYLERRTLQDERTQAEPVRSPGKRWALGAFFFFSITDLRVLK